MSDSIRLRIPLDGYPRTAEMLRSVPSNTRAALVAHLVEMALIYEEMGLLDPGTADGRQQIRRADDASPVPQANTRAPETGPSPEGDLQTALRNVYLACDAEEFQ